MKYEQKLKEQQKENKKLKMQKGNRYEESKKRHEDILERKKLLHMDRRKV